MSNTNPRAADLAQRFEQVNQTWLALVEPLSESQWRTHVDNEGRSVAVMTYHIASSHTAVVGWLQGMLAGQGLPPVTPPMLDQYNARQAIDAAHCGHAETVAMLRQATTNVADAIRGLSEAQLDQTAPLALIGGDTVSAAGLIEFVLIGHAQSHLASVQAALGRD